MKRKEMIVVIVSVLVMCSVYVFTVVQSDKQKYLGCIYLADKILESKTTEIENRYGAGEFRGGTASGLFQQAEAERDKQYENCNELKTNNTVQ